MNRQTKRAASSRSVVLFGLLLVVLAARGAWWVINDSRLALASQQWLSTQGLIVRSRVSRTGLGTAGDLIAYAPRVTYRYQVHETSYTGTVISYPSRRGARHWAEQVVARYPAGALVAVLYNPEDPQQSCLERGARSWFFILMIGGISLLLFAGGSWFVFAGWRATRV